MFDEDWQADQIFHLADLGMFEYRNVFALLTKMQGFAKRTFAVVFDSGIHPGQELEIVQRTILVDDFVGHARIVVSVRPLGFHARSVPILSAPLYGRVSLDVGILPLIIVILVRHREAEKNASRERRVCLFLLSPALFYVVPGH